MMRISLRLYLIFFSLLLIGFIIFSYSFAPLSANTTSSATSVIEETLSGVTALRFTDKGKLQQLITMESWEHHKGKNTSAMVKPSLKIYQADGSIWQISAQKGEGFHQDILGKLAKVHLSHNVIIERLAHPSGSWLKLHTENLQFFPQESKASTEEVVTVKGPQMEIQATGMLAFLDRHTMTFLKNVKSYYAKTKSL